MSGRIIRLPERDVIFTITAYADGMMIINDDDLEEHFPGPAKLALVIRMIRNLADAMEEGRAMPGPPPR